MRIERDGIRTDPMEGALLDTLYSASIYRHDNPAWGFDPSGHGLPACLIGLDGGFFGAVAGIAQTIDGSLQKNALSAAGVGGIFAASAGASACLKCYRARVGGQQNNDGCNQSEDSDDEASEGSISSSDPVATSSQSTNEAIGETELCARATS